MVALAFATFGCSVAGALEGITAEDVANGTFVSRSACLLQTDAVWVEHARGDVCIRYYVAGRASAERDLVAYFRGDIGNVPGNTMRVEDVVRPEIMSAAAHQKIADGLSRALGQAVVVVARPGLGGSSGWHGWRRNPYEVEVMNSALSQIVKRLPHARLHLMGASGGAHNAGSLLAFRTDVGCAMIGSGRLWFDNDLRDRNERAKPIWKHFEPAARAGEIARHGARIFVVYDPEDRWVRPEQQTRFVDAVRNGGGRATAIQARARGADHHDVQAQVNQVARNCIAGLSDDEIVDGASR